MGKIFKESVSLHAHIDGAGRLRELVEEVLGRNELSSEEVLVAGFPNTEKAPGEAEAQFAWIRCGMVQHIGFIQEGRAGIGDFYDAYEESHANLQRGTFTGTIAVYDKAQLQEIETSGEETTSNPAFKHRTTTSFQKAIIGVITVNYEDERTALEG